MTSRLLDNKAIREHIAERIVKGDTQGQVARDFNIHTSTISHWKDKSEFREAIEKAQLELLDGLPDAVQNLLVLVKEFPKIPKKDHKRRELSYRAGKDIQIAFGLMPSAGKSETLNLIYNAPGSHTISPGVLALISGAVANMKIEAGQGSEDEGIIEGEYEIIE